MSEPILLSINWHDWLALFLHTASLSLVAVGGVITILSAMHLYLVDQHGWMTDVQFNASYALAQAAPGPNVLYMALFGWTIGLSTGSMPMGLWGAAVMLTGMLLPCCTLTFFASRWLQQNRERLAVRAFRQGMMPAVLGLMFAAAWMLMTGTYGDFAHDWPAWALTAVTALLIWRTRLHILWPLAAGAVLGWFGLV